MAELLDQFERVRSGTRDHEADIPETVDAILRAAREAEATDVHLTPTADALRMQWRIDGVLHAVTEFPREDAPRLIARLKVLAGLLTYRTDIPQEGRIGSAHETRLSTFPTLFGEKAVVRLFGEAGRYQWLEQLGLPEDIHSTLRRLLEETSGVILFTGPAGSGKTTTIYSCLREILAATGGARCVATIEDPVEVVLEGTAQAQVDAGAGFDLAGALRALMRQDPEVIMVGEIRDQATAEAVFQAALTGHLVLTTFHSGSATGAIGRLLDMGIEPYLLRSCVRAVVAQRLVRQLCSCSKVRDREPGELDDIDAPQIREPVGCENCAGTGYAGRVPVAEMLVPDTAEAGRAILSRSDIASLEASAVAAGMVTQRQRALNAVKAGTTSPGEVHRVFGRAKGPDDG